MKFNIHDYSTDSPTLLLLTVDLVERCSLIIPLMCSWDNISVLKVETCHCPSLLVSKLPGQNKGKLWIKFPRSLTEKIEWKANKSLAFDIYASEFSEKSCSQHFLGGIQWHFKSALHLQLQLVSFRYQSSGPTQNSYSGGSGSDAVGKVLNPLVMRSWV